MRRILFVFIVVVVVVFADAVKHSDEILEHFAKFRAHHAKKYTNSAEEARRLAHFADNHKRIAELNAAAKRDGRNVSFGVNKFADKTRAEFHARLSRVTPGEHKELPVFHSKHRKHLNRTKRATIPRNFDLRDVTIDGNPIIGPIKNQAECGCCWAFATTAVTETANAIASKEYTSLSDQEICDCADTNDTPGCVGGDPRNGLQFVHRHGQTDSAEYPYEEFRANTTGNCVADEKETVIEPEAMEVYRFDDDYAEEDIMENLFYNHIPRRTTIDV